MYVLKFGVGEVTGERVAKPMTFSNTYKCESVDILKETFVTSPVMCVLTKAAILSHSMTLS